MSLQESEADNLFAQFLADRNLSPCQCGRKIDRADVAWNCGQTEAGTEYSCVEVQCLNCLEEIIYWTSWHSDITDFEDLVENVLEDAPSEQGKD
jgi:hypothetical protein